MVDWHQCYLRALAATGPSGRWHCCHVAAMLISGCCLYLGIQAVSVGGPPRYGSGFSGVRPGLSWNCADGRSVNPCSCFNSNGDASAVLRPVPLLWRSVFLLVPAGAPASPPETHSARKSQFSASPVKRVPSQHVHWSFAGLWLVIRVSGLRLHMISQFTVVWNSPCTLFESPLVPQGLVTCLRWSETCSCPAAIFGCDGLMWHWHSRSQNTRARCSASTYTPAFTRLGKKKACPQTPVQIITFSFLLTVYIFAYKFLKSRMGDKKGTG